MYVVTPSIRLDGTSAVATHRARVLQARDGTIARAAAAAPQAPTAPCDDQAAETEQREHHVADRPESRLLIERQQRLDDERVREQRRAGCPRFPRRRGNTDRVRRCARSSPASAGAAGSPSSRRRRARRLRSRARRAATARATRPRAAARARGRSAVPRPPARARPRERSAGARDRADASTRAHSRSREQNRLEEEHRGRPDGLRAAEERQDHPSNHRLHEEDERRAGEDRGPKSASVARLAKRACRGAAATLAAVRSTSPPSAGRAVG